MSTTLPAKREKPTVPNLNYTWMISGILYHGGSDVLFAELTVNLKAKFTFDFLHEEGISRVKVQFKNQCTIPKVLQNHKRLMGRVRLWMIQCNVIQNLGHLLGITSKSDTYSHCKTRSFLTVSQVNHSFVGQFRIGHDQQNIIPSTHRSRSQPHSFLLADLVLHLYDVTHA